jgi:hypothetical protein
VFVGATIEQLIVLREALMLSCQQRPPETRLEVQKMLDAVVLQLEIALRQV